LVVIHEPVLEISCGQKQCAQTHRHTPMTTRPCGLRRAGKKCCHPGHSFWLKYAPNCSAAGLRPRPYWGSSERSPKPP